MASAAVCQSCKSPIRGESGIQCNGICGKNFHSSSKCSGLDQYSLKVLDGNNFVRYMCDECVQYIRDVDMVVKEIQYDVQRSRQSLKDYKDEFEMSLKKNEIEMKQLLEAIEKRYEERFKKMEAIQKNWEKSMQGATKICDGLNQLENKNKELCEKIDENKSMCAEIKKTITEANVKQVSYAEAAKKVLPDPTKNLALIVKPKIKQNVKKTKSVLNEKVDPGNFKIRNVENRNNGALVIESENAEEREKIKNAIEIELNEDYEVRVPKPTEFSVIITDISFKYSETEIVEKLMKQNPVLNNSELRILRIYETKRYNKTVYNVKLNLEHEVYVKIMDMQRLNIGWERCRVFDGTDVTQCFKCRGYNHIAKECRNQEMCLNCHGCHKTNECDKESINKCINCVRENKKLNLNLDENHATSYKKCPVYLNRLNLKKKRLGLVD